VHQVGQDYIGLLVLGIFNAVIPRDHIRPEFHCRVAVRRARPATSLTVPAFANANLVSIVNLVGCQGGWIHACPVRVEKRFFLKEWAVWRPLIPPVS
jgi:hypothetical protein